jgi:hypothetical protein
MPETSSLDDIMQQLDALTLPELLQVKAKVDVLIKVKSLTSYNAAVSTAAVAAIANTTGTVSTNSQTFGFIAKVITGVYRIKDSLGVIWSIFTSKSLRDFNRNGLFEVYGSSHVLNKIEILDIYNSFQSTQLKVDKDNSLEKLIGLVDQWMDDESGYDEETFPQIEAALNQNHPSH